MTNRKVGSTVEQSRPYLIIVVVAVLFGLIISGFYLGRVIYRNKYTASLRISFVYPEISEGMYPDGKRFSMYDLVDNDRVAEALAYMQAKGLYSEYSIPDLQNELYVSSYLTNEVQNKVISSLSSGTDFTYYSNEYIVCFRQPSAINFSSPDTFLGLFPEDYSRIFLDALIRANAEYILEYHAENETTFATFTKMEQLKNFDFGEIGDYYYRKVSNVLDYLYEKEDNSNGFISSSTGVSFNDLITTSQVLMNVNITQFRNYVSSSRLTNQLTQLVNMKKTAIENNLLEYEKANDQAEYNTYAMENYDHTFTDNILIVVANNKNGLYQARPKTAYDTVVSNFLSIRSTASQYEALNEMLKKEIADYTSVTQNAQEYLRQCALAITLLDGIESSYATLIDIVQETVSDYLETANSSYFTTKVSTQNSFAISDLIKALILFASGTGVILLLWMIKKSTNLKRREKQKIELISSLTE